MTITSRGTFHAGPSLPGRMRAAYAWLGSVLISPDPQATQTRQPIANGSSGEGKTKGNPPMLDPLSSAMVRAYRRWLAPARERTAKIDPTTNRRYGILPPIKLQGGAPVIRCWT
jgi:hypothetical protein